MTELATVFRHLHAGPEPLRLVNAWDALSARVFALAGAPAIGTSSFAIALSRGYMDGQRIPAEEMVAVAASIVKAVDVPVTVDIEAGYGADPAGVDRVVAQILATGAVGINLEDGRPDSPGELFDSDEQCRRIAAARSRADQENMDLFVNARCDVYFGASLEHGQHLPAALGRLGRYVNSGADGVFLPGLTDLGVVTQVTDAVKAPLNLMLGPAMPSVTQLRDAGVRRISQGGAAFLQSVGYLSQVAAAYLEVDDLTTFGGGITPGFQVLPGLVR